MAKPEAKDQNSIELTEASALVLSPDGYSRFFVIVRLLEELYQGTGETINILDVGGCSPYLYERLMESQLEFELTIVDILPKPPNIKVTYIQEDITQSKMKDNSYDVVLSTDVLEHIPKELKDTFVRACVRLSKELVIIAAPFDTPGVDAAEQMVNSFNKQLFKVGQDWLEEHFMFGKPKIDQTKSVLDSLKFPYEHFGTNNLYSWVISTHLTLIKGKLGVDPLKHTEVNTKYNKLLSHSVEFTDPTYRHFFLVFKDKKFTKRGILKTIAGEVDPQTFSSYLHEMFKLVAERMNDLKHESDASLRKAQKLEQKLYNEKIHSNKLNTILIQQAAELERLAPLRRLIPLRHPAQALKSVNRKMLRKK